MSLLPWHPFPFWLQVGPCRAPKISSSGPRTWLTGSWWEMIVVDQENQGLILKAMKPPCRSLSGCLICNMKLNQWQEHILISLLLVLVQAVKNTCWVKDGLICLIAAHFISITRIHWTAMLVEYTPWAVSPTRPIHQYFEDYVGRCLSLYLDKSTAEKVLARLAGWLRWAQLLLDCFIIACFQPCHYDSLCTLMISHVQYSTWESGSAFWNGNGGNGVLHGDKYSS